LGQKQTCAAQERMSAMGQKQTCAAQNGMRFTLESERAGLVWLIGRLS